MTYEEFLALVDMRHAGAPAFEGMQRRGWQRWSYAGEPFRWEKHGAGGRVVAHEGDAVWLADTRAEWKAQHGKEMTDA